METKLNLFLNILICSLKLTLKKLRIDASSHIDLILHRDNCDSGGSRTNGVTIVLYGLGGEGGCSSSSSSSSSISLREGRRLDFCFRPPVTTAASAAAAAYNRAAERAVHAREGLSLLTTASLPLLLFAAVLLLSLISPSQWIGDEDGSSDIMRGSRGAKTWGYDYLVRVHIRDHWVAFKRN